MSLILSQFFSEKQSFEPQTLEFLGVPYGPDDASDLAYCQALARSTVIKMYRAYVRRKAGQHEIFTMFKNTLKELNAWPTSSLTSSSAWADVFYSADTFRAKAYKYAVMSLMLEDARTNGTEFLEYFCAQHYHLIWNSREGYARGHESLVDQLVKKQN
jgi:hypothetical protein